MMNNSFDRFTDPQKVPEFPFPDQSNHDLQVTHRVMAARQAQLYWATKPLRERLALMSRLRHALAGQADTLATAIKKSQHSSIAETLVAEILPLADACRFLEREAEQILAAQRWSVKSRPGWLHGVEIEVQREPYGVVLLITSSNYPLFLPGVQALQALVAGNAVLLKPGTGGLTAATALAKICKEAGLDEPLLQVLPETPEGVQAAVEAGVDKVLLTGSATTGTEVLSLLSTKLVPATLELSGCDAVFVREDADLDLVVRALRFGLCLNNGATCIAPRRVFVAHTLAPTLETLLAQAVSEVRPSAVEPAVAVRVKSLVKEALQSGAHLISGKVLNDDILTPIVVANATPTMRLLQEDIFVPVLSLVSVRDDEEALAAAAHCPYALGATIFGSESAARKLANQVRAGSVVINDIIVPTADPRFSFGGRGRSGFGVTRGAAGLLDLTMIKTIAIRRSRWLPHLDKPSALDGELFQKYITVVHGARLRDRIAAGLSFLQILIKRARDKPTHQKKEKGKTGDFLQNIS